MKMRHNLIMLVALASLVFTTTFANGAPAATKPSLTRIWVGEEMLQFGGEHFKGDPAKSWRLIPGAKLSIHYSGSGPLPKPVEFVIPLDKPLPLGSVYYLSTKNWYVGKMDATVGDITQPLEMKRYDWTPIARFEPNEIVTKIVLRFYPSTIVADTGKAQTQPLVVQGVFISNEPTKVPFEGGEIISLLPHGPPVARKGNCFENGSFETGLYPWGPAMGLSHAKLIGPQNLDDLTAAQGKHSLKIAADGAFGLNNRMYNLCPGTYTFSFYAKADRPVELGAKIKGLHSNLKEYADTDISGKFDLGTEWKRYSITDQIREMPGFLYTAEFRGKADEPTNIWLDGIQLENGDLTDYQAHDPVEIGYFSAKPGRIYYVGEDLATVDLLLHRTTNQQPMTVQYKVEDYWGKQVDQGRMFVDLKGEDTRIRMPLFEKKEGLFRLLLTAGDAQAEMVYSVVPSNPHLNSTYPQGTLGTDAQLYDPHSLAILKRANFNWIMEKTMARWYIVEEKQGQFQFFDNYIKNANDAHVLLLLQVFNLRPHYRLQPWLAPYVIPTTGEKSVRDFGIWKENKKDEFFKYWTEFLFKTVDHYKESVKHWEIFNEPNYDLTGEDYGYALKLSAEAVRRADPQAHVVGFAGGGFNRGFYDNAFKTAGSDALDIASVHFYGNTEKPMQEYGEMLDSIKKPGWNTETGPTCPSFYTTLPSFASLQQADYRQRELADLHTQTEHSVKNYLLTRSLGRMDKWFHYFARFTNSSPSQTTKWSGNGKELAEFDGSLRGNGVGLCIASHFLDEATYQGPVQKDERLQAQVFQKGNTSVGFLWANAEQTLTLTPVDGLTFYDVMGNQIDDKPLSVTDSPIYFTFAGDPESCRKRFSGVKTESAK